MYGAITSWEALKAKGKLGNNFLVMGPWRHSQINRTGTSLGPFQWNGDTAKQFREDMVLPLFNQYLKDGAPANLPSAAIYNTGENHWDKLTQWPLACQSGCAAPLTPLYLADDKGLSFDKPEAGADAYVSDPANPVPHLSRPVNFNDGRWGDWLVSDQRHADGRTDVVTYTTPVLTKAVRVSGAPIADLFARTTGTDGDFVVKIIDVLPPEDAIDPKMGGYELPISLDIFRGVIATASPTPPPSGGQGAGIQVSPADREPCVPAGPPDHDPGPVQPVPALRPQSADLRAQYLHGQGQRLQEGDDHAGARRCQCQPCLAAGGAARPVGGDGALIRPGGS